MDLIDKNALIDKCLGWNGNVVTCDAGADFCDRHATCIECIIDTMPLIDAVPVVRCKDCKHWFNNIAGYTGDEIGHCEWAGWMVGKNGYCVYGERKEVQDGKANS